MRRFLKSRLVLPVSSLQPAKTQFTNPDPAITSRDLCANPPISRLGTNLDNGGLLGNCAGVTWLRGGQIPALDPGYSSLAALRLSGHHSKRQARAILTEHQRWSGYDAGILQWYDCHDLAAAK